MTVAPLPKCLADLDESRHQLEIMLPDLNGHVRGKLLNIDPAEDLRDYPVLLPASALTSDFCGNCIDETGLVWEKGDPDYLCRLELDSLKPVPWKAGTAQALITMPEVDFAPRTLLKAVMTRLAQRGLSATVAMELEFSLTIQDTTTTMAKMPYSRAVDNRMRLYDVSATEDHEQLFEAMMAAARVQNIPADTIIAEAAPGQYEINLRHVDNALLAADHALLLKRLIKGVAKSHGVRASFMAKPYAGFSGNGLHVHVSIQSRAGGNIFYPGNEALLHAISGLQRTMHASQIMLHPNANSFKRITPNSYAPCSSHWGYNNRNVALRIPAGDPEHCRIEHRLAGADANPYLVMACVLMGIDHGLSTPQTPTPETQGALSPKGGVAVHYEPGAALADFQGSDIIADYFGAEFQRIYAICHGAEIARYHTTIMPIEHDWFFDTA